jgi:hypothetical protein
VTLEHMTQRTRTVLGPADHACGLCGDERVMLVESRRVRRLADRFTTSWNPHVRLTETCQGCGARTRVDNVVAPLPPETGVAAAGQASSTGRR